jgi:hypothetical protein
MMVETASVGHGPHDGSAHRGTKAWARRFKLSRAAAAAAGTHWQPEAPSQSRCVPTGTGSGPARLRAQAEAPAAVRRRPPALNRDGSCSLAPPRRAETSVAAGRRGVGSPA